MSLCAPLCLSVPSVPLCPLCPSVQLLSRSNVGAGDIPKQWWAFFFSLASLAAARPCHCICVFVFVYFCVCICVFVCMYLYICVYVFVFVLHICICPLWRLRDQVPLPPHLTSSPITFAEAAVRQLSDHRPIPNRPERRVGPGGPSASIARGPGSARVSRQSSVARLG